MQAVLGLGQNSFNYQALGTVGFEAAIALARTTRAYTLTYGDLDVAIAQIEHLFVSAT
jgi:hypothetical protein